MPESGRVAAVQRLARSNTELWQLRRGLASLVASSICAGLGLLLLFDPWSTPTMDDVEKDSWVHGLVVLPFIFVALLAISDQLGSHLLRTGHRSVLAFMRKATVWLVALSLSLFAPAAIVASAISFGTLRQVVEGLATGIGCFLIPSLPAALAWRVIAGEGPSTHPSGSDPEAPPLSRC